MSNDEIILKAVNRAKRAGVNVQEPYNNDFILFLEKEIGAYCKRIEHLEEIIMMNRQPIKNDIPQNITADNALKALSDNGYKRITVNFYKE